MAKFLAYKRDTREVVTVDTVRPSTAVLGNTIAAADITNAFPGRSENLLAIFLGDPYLLYRAAANEIRLSKYDYTGGTWSDVPGFTAISGGAGVITPTCLRVVKDRLVAVATLSNSAGADAIYARRSDAGDAAVWDPAVSTLFPTQPLDTRAGASIVWHNAVFFTTADGICVYDPDSDSFVATFDQGDDAAIVGQKVNFGSFEFINDFLYYVLATDSPVGAPSLYRLDGSWSVSSPSPVFTNQSVVIPAVGGVTVSNDTGNYALFVNGAGSLSLIYSGGLGSKLVTIAAVGAAYSISDVTSALLPATLSGAADLGFSIYADDRDSSSQKLTIIVRFRSASPAVVVLARWDGVTAVSQTGTLDNGGSGLDLMLPDDCRSDFVTYTANQPTAFITATSAPFPGRIRIDYSLRDSGARTMDVTPQYSIDGHEWLNMSQGDGDSGITSLASSVAGTAYFFHWDAFSDLTGSYDNIDIRVVARISGV